MNFDLTVLGAGSATPAYGRHHSAFLVNHNRKSFLVDCGEGTQIRMLECKKKVQSLDHIFISHLHGDHFFGVIGVLSTLHLLGRKRDLHLYAPIGLEEVIMTQCRVSNTFLRYKICFHPLDFEQQQLLFENSNLEIYSFPLDHGIEACGFLFKEKLKPYKLHKDALPSDISLEEISRLLHGKDIIRSGKTIFKNEELTLGREKSRRFAYCSDTAYNTSYFESIQDADLLYHEATFLDEHKERAASTKHSTASEAARVANKCGVNQLLIGHFSARYKNLITFITEAKVYFEKVQLAEEGKTYNIG